jgi:uncharacterized protein (DUF433 family)
MTEDLYVELRDGEYRIRGSRVSLASLVAAFRSGDSPETIAREAFPTLKLEQVYGAIAFYLSHRADLDTYLELEAKEFERRRDAQRQADPETTRRFADARQQPRTGR